jgi:hypothetical protein
MSSGPILRQTEPLRADLNNNPFDLVEGDLIVAAVVELGRPGAFMCGHLLGVFQQTAIEQIHRNTGRPKAMASKPRDDAGLQDTADDHPARP